VCVIAPATAANPDPVAQPPLIYGDGNRVEFYASTGAPNAVPQRRVLSYDPATHAISESVYQGVPATGDTNNLKGQTQLPISGALAQSSTTRQVLANVYPRDTGVPIFTYRTYSLNQVSPAPNAKYEPTGNTVELPAPVTAAEDLPRVSEIQVAIRVRPADLPTTVNSPLDAILEGAAFTRFADPGLAVVADNVKQLPTGEYVGRAISCT
jgi:hypothetical protein